MSEHPTSPLVASADELRVLAHLLGGPLPAVCDGDLPADDEALADLVAVRTLLARGWLAEDGPLPEVAAALAPVVGADVVVEVEVEAAGDHRRRALAVGPQGARALVETHLGVWSVEAADADPAVVRSWVPEGDAVVDLDLDDDPDATVAAVLAGRGHDVVLRMGRRTGAEAAEVLELRWLQAGARTWQVVEDDDPDAADPVVTFVALEPGELRALIGELLAPVAGERVGV